MEKSEKAKRQKLLLLKIVQFRFFEYLMSKLFRDDIESTEFLLKIILQRDDLKVIESKGHVTIKNLLGALSALILRLKIILGNSTILKYRGLMNKL